MSSEIPEQNQEVKFLDNAGTKRYTSMEQVDVDMGRLSLLADQMEKDLYDSSGSELIVDKARNYARVLAELDDLRRLKHNKPWSHLATEATN